MKVVIDESNRLMVVKAIVVEDSRLARRELTELLKIFPEIEIVKEADNINKAKQIIETLKPDLIFLDINMPGGNGFELLESLASCPEVIFTTAYDEYAVKAFEYNALDYLLKPINTKRLAQAVGKIKDRISVVRSLEGSNNLKRLGKIFIKDGDRCWIVEHEKIKYFESSGNYVKIHFDNNKPMLYKSLNKIEETLDDDLFVRASRQFIINKKFISSIHHSSEKGLSITMDDKKVIAISRRNTFRVKKILPYRESNTNI